VTRFVDRGAIVAAYVGIGMALVIGVSFLLVIPIEPAYWLLAPLSGLLIGYYADARADRRSGPWRRILGNGLFAGLVTGLSLAILLLGVKALFFSADNGYRDQAAGGSFGCSGGGDCVYRRYLIERGTGEMAAAIGAPVGAVEAAERVFRLPLAGPVLQAVVEASGAGSLRTAGVHDAASFSSFYWSQELSTAVTLIAVTLAGSAGGALAFGLTRPSPRSRPTRAEAAPPA
jgi:hypothetical protein